MKLNNKQQLFKNLQGLKLKIDELEGKEEKAELKKYLVQVDDIVKAFNSGKRSDGTTDLDLDDLELKQLHDTVNEIWENVEKKGDVPWPKPDIVTKIG